jgi:AcrR family transcriptional regulator
LDAAVNWLSEHPARRPSLRALAQHAGVTAALLNYHFTDLDGLLGTLLKERAQPLWEELFDRTDDHTAGVSLTRFVQRWTATLLRHRWLLPCLLQAPRAAEWGAQLRQLVRNAQRDGALRTDLPEDYVAMLLLSIGALPQLAATALGGGIALPAEPAAASQFTLRHLSVLETGLRPRAP